MIVTDENILRQVSAGFDGSCLKLALLIDELIGSLENSELNGVGLASIQIGKPICVGIIRTPKLKLDLVNTEIISGTNAIVVEEGCLSYPNQFIKVMRMQQITIKNKGSEILTFKGFEAQAIQHEVDHFRGITMLDRRV